MVFPTTWSASETQRSAYRRRGKITSLHAHETSVHVERSTVDKTSNQEADQEDQVAPARINFFGPSRRNARGGGVGLLRGRGLISRQSRFLRSHDSCLYGLCDSLKIIARWRES